MHNDDEKLTVEMKVVFIALKMRLLVEFVAHFSCDHETIKNNSKQKSLHHRLPKYYY